MRLGCFGAARTPRSSILAGMQAPSGERLSNVRGARGARLERGAVASRRPSLGCRVGLVLLSLVVAGCNDPFGVEKACTEIGCLDGFQVIFEPSSRWPAGSYEILVDIDGESTRCTGSLPLPACASGAALQCSPASSSVSIGESGCALPSAEHGFTGFAIPLPMVSSVRVAISRDGATLVDSTLTPSYQTFQPNGEGCEPICESGSATLQVPLAP